MNLKQREKPLRLSALEACMGRLDPEHPKLPLLQASYANYSKGYQGELALADPMSVLSDKNHFILNGIRLTHNKEHHFQIDTLLLSSSFHLIIEAKNLSGTLRFNSQTNNFEQILDGKVKHYSDPILQVQRQKNHLEIWLRKNKYPPNPIETIVVICNPRTQIEATTEADLQRVLRTVTRLAKLPQKVRSLEKRHQIEKIPISELRKISRKIIKEDTPHRPNILHEFNIPESDILTGVHCPKCSFIPMIRQQRKWYCPKCSCYSKDAHLAALRDYALLFKTEVTNFEVKQFLQLASSEVTRKILANMNLPYTGKNRGRTYILPLD